MQSTIELAGGKEVQMASVIEVRFDVRFREKHETPDGDECDGLACLEVTQRTFEKAARAEDPKTVFPKVICPDCGAEMPVDLADWTRTATSAVGHLRGEVEDLASAAYNLEIADQTGHLVDLVTGEHEYFAQCPERMAESFVKHCMLQATDLAREQLKDIARVY